jgi:hypothetical protein
MSVKFTPSALPPVCPKCAINMLMVAGYGLEPDKKTFECRQCGYIEKPSPAKTNSYGWT